MRKLNLTALVLLSFIAKAGYGSEDLIPADGSTMVAAAGGGAPSVVDNRIGNLLTSGIAGAVTHFLSNDKGIDERIALGLSDDDLRALFQNPRIAQICDVSEPTAVMKKMGHFLGNVEEWRYDQKVEEFITSYFATGTRDDAALTAKLSEIRPKDAATVMWVLGETIPPLCMMGGDKESFIKDLLRLSPEEFRDFITICDDLSGGMYRYQLIIALLNVPQERLTDTFVQFANELTVGMTGHYKTSIIKALAKIPAEKLTYTFVREVNILTNGMSEYRKDQIIPALANVPENITPDFVRFAKALTNGMSEYDKAPIIIALAKIPAEKLTDTFVRGVNDLTSGMSEDPKAKIIIALARVPEKITPDFVAFAKAFTNGMSEYDKAQIIPALVKISAENMISFIRTANDLTSGLDIHYKTYFFSVLADVPASNYAALMKSVKANVKSGMSQHAKSDIIANKIKRQIPDKRKQS